MKPLLLLSLLAAVLLMSFAWAEKKEPEALSWPQQMQKMSKAINDLIPYTYSYSAFHDDANQEQIKKSIHALSEAIHTIPIKGSDQVTGKDPLVNSSLQELETDLALAKTNFDEGNLEYARALLQGAVHHCFRCHSRSQFGPEFIKSPAEFDEVSLSLTEQADLYVATRQYAKAMTVLRKQLSAPKNVFESQYETEQILKKYLAIAVRIKKDPKHAIETLGTLLDKKGIPFYLRQDTSHWVSSLTEWSNAKPMKPSRKAASALIESGEKMQEEIGYQRGYIEYLRGSAMFHDLLRQKDLSDVERAEIYLALGQSYEVIHSLGLWELPEIYYEDCIRQAPKTDVAKRCYQLFERDTFQAYTGSAGTFIPMDQRKLLQDLCQLAGIEYECYEPMADEEVYD